MSDPDESDGAPTVPVVCEACGTRAEVPLAEAADAVERHNDRLHDGEERATVDPALVDELADLVAEDLDLL